VGSQALVETSDTGEDMTRDEIIRLAEECYIPEFENNVSQADCILLFAESLIDAERKRIIQKNALEIERINAWIDRDTALLRQVQRVMGLMGADLICGAAHHEKADRQKRWHEVFATLRERLGESK
jgi:hypothetical protein